MSKNASVLDYTRAGLDESIWDVTQTEIRLKPELKLQIIDIVESALDDFDVPMEAIEGLFIYGSILTNQYNDKTDVDCRILLNKEMANELYPELTGEDIFHVLEDQLHGTLLGDTKHPLNCSVIIEGEQRKLGEEEYDPVYDVGNDLLITGPVIAEDTDPYEEFKQERNEIEEVMEKLDELLRDVKTKTIDYEVLKEAVKEVKNPKELKKKIEERLEGIKKDITKLVKEYERIKDERTEAFKDENVENPHIEPGNVKHKFLERYQYLDLLRKLKKIYKEGIDEEEIPQIEEILSIQAAENLYIEKLDFGMPDIDVWLVDGKVVRDKLDIEFTLAGNECRYPFIPRNEIWIEDMKNRADVPFILLHEMRERALMLDGMDYDPAHEKASELESHCRKYPGDLVDELEKIINFDPPSINIQDVIDTKKKEAQQKDYPQKPLERGEQTPIPEPIGYVYHVSPYAKEILEQGFIVDPTKTVLGAFGPASSISTTNYENAVLYRDSIRFIVGIANGELDWNDIFEYVKQFGATDAAIKDGVGHVMKEEYLTFWEKNLDFYKLLEQAKAKNEKANVNDAVQIKKDFFAEYMPAEANIDDQGMEFIKSSQGKDWLFDKLVNKVDFYNNPISLEQDKYRKWKFLQFIAFSSTIPLVMGVEVPAHLVNKQMDDVQIVEIAVAPVEFSKSAPHRDEQGKGKYTYVFSEEEWRFYDVTDLWPIRIID